VKGYHVDGNGNVVKNATPSKVAPGGRNGLTADQLAGMQHDAGKAAADLYHGVTKTVNGQQVVVSYTQTYQDAIKTLMQQYPKLGRAAILKLVNAWYKPGEYGRPGRPPRSGRRARPDPCRGRTTVRWRASRWPAAPSSVSRRTAPQTVAAPSSVSHRKPGDEKKKGGGGILHAIGHAGHVVGEKAALAAHDLKAAPGGAIDFVNTGAVQPWKDVLTTGHVSKKHNAAIDKLINEQSDAVEQTLSHPLKDPFATVLTVAPILHGAGRVAERGVEAGRAAKAGEGAKGVVRAATRTPEVRQRLISVGDRKVPLHASKSPVVRLAQELHDKLVQKAIDTNPEGRVAAYGNRRAGGSLMETARYQQRMREVPANLLDQAAKRLAPTRGKLPGTTLQPAATRRAGRPRAREREHRARACDRLPPQPGRERRRADPQPCDRQPVQARRRPEDAHRRRARRRPRQQRRPSEARSRRHRARARPDRRRRDPHRPRRAHRRPAAEGRRRARPVPRRRPLREADARPARQGLRRAQA
jgi:hypothetical protein